MLGSVKRPNLRFGSLPRPGTPSRIALPSRFSWHGSWTSMPPPPQASYSGVSIQGCRNSHAPLSRPASNQGCRDWPSPNPPRPTSNSGHPGTRLTAKAGSYRRRAVPDGACLMINLGSARHRFRACSPDANTHQPGAPNGPRFPKESRRAHECAAPSSPGFFAGRRGRHHTA